MMDDHDTDNGTKAKPDGNLVQVEFHGTPLG